MLMGHFWYRKGSNVLHPAQMMKTMLFLALLYGDIRSAVCSLTSTHTCTRRTQRGGVTEGVLRSWLFSNSNLSSKGGLKSA